MKRPENLIYAMDEWLPLPIDFGEQLPFARGLLAAWHCVPPDPLSQTTQGAHCRIHLVF
jgi:hypothetical protein